MFCSCGCGGLAPISKQTDKSRGYVAMKPRPYINHHWSNPKKYKVNEKTGCWEWLLGKGYTGYGQSWYKDKSGKVIKTTAHRVMYLKMIGPIRPGYQLDHLCRNTSCVNPEHLEQVTPAENTRRSSLAKINISIAREIREIYKTGKFSMTSLGGKFNISREMIGQIVNNKRWVESL